MWSQWFKSGLILAGTFVFLSSCQSVPTLPFPTEAPTMVEPTLPTAPPATPTNTPIAGATLDCSSCHGAVVSLWASGAHGNT
jgi:hypothetical protein